ILGRDGGGGGQSRLDVFAIIEDRPIDREPASGRDLGALLLSVGLLLEDIVSDLLAELVRKRLGFVRRHVLELLLDQVQRITGVLLEVVTKPFVVGKPQSTLTAGGDLTGKRPELLAIESREQGTLLHCVKAV